MYHVYRISSNYRRASYKRRTPISAAPLGIHIEICVSPLLSVAPLTAARCTKNEVFH